MSNRFLISKPQVVGAFIYAIAFPLSGLIGGGVQIFLLFATAPFLAIGYIFGGLSAGIFSSTKAYPFGLAIAIFIQVCVLLALWNKRKVLNRESNT